MSNNFPFSDTGLPPGVRESDIDGEYGRGDDQYEEGEVCSPFDGPARRLEPSNEAVLKVYRDEGIELYGMLADDLSEVGKDEAHRALGRRLHVLFVKAGLM